MRLVSVGGSRRRILLLARRIRAPPLLEMVAAHALAASWVRHSGSDFSTACRGSAPGAGQSVRGRFASSEVAALVALVLSRSPMPSSFDFYMQMRLH